MRNLTGPRVVAIGGGTGLSTMLRGLKRLTRDITAVVTVADDGGGSGVLRQELGMPPPGDVRNCLQALANTEPTMEALLAYRFRDGSLKGQSLGNLFLAALNDMSGSFDEAVMRMSEVLAITGRVLPVTNENVQLAADFDDGSSVLGESRIAEHKKQTSARISRVCLLPERPAALPAAIEAVERADMIIVGPGSLYTSVIPNLLTQGLTEAIAASRATKIYVLNVMTQDGETEGYTASEHIRALYKHSSEKLFDVCLANSLPIPAGALESYAREGAAPTLVDEAAVRALGVELRRAPVAAWNGYIRHDPDALAGELMGIFHEKSPTRIYI